MSYLSETTDWQAMAKALQAALAASQAEAEGLRQANAVATKLTEMRAAIDALTDVTPSGEPGESNESEKAYSQWVEDAHSLLVKILGLLNMLSPAKETT